MTANVIITDLADVFGSTSSASTLPASSGTLYELSRLDAPVLAATAAVIYAITEPSVGGRPTNKHGDLSPGLLSISDLAGVRPVVGPQVIGDPRPGSLTPPRKSATPKGRGSPTSRSSLGGPAPSDPRPVVFLSLRAEITEVRAELDSIGVRLDLATDVNQRAIARFGLRVGGRWLEELESQLALVDD